MVDQWIDVHAHFYPPETEEEIYARWEAMKQLCWTNSEPPRWSPESTLAYMDSVGIAMQMLSNIPKSHEKLRASNDYAASLVRAYPSRFGFLAALPTDDADTALAEIARSSGDLRADGFAVTFRYNDVALSDPRLTPVWEELNRRQAVIFAHPDAYSGGVMGRPCALMDVAFETARVTTDLIYQGIFRKFPDVTMILAHCGGALPAMSGRLLLLGNEGWIPNPNRITAEEMKRYLRRLFLDTAGVCPTALAPALVMTSHDHLVYGSDCGVPCSTDRTMNTNLRALLDFPDLTSNQLQTIGRRALELFPSVKERLATIKE
jgi:predicted TIM-barrel fold metal-dependent hydrolase